MNQNPNEKIQQLSIIEQNVQQIIMQRKQLVMQLTEVDNALKELKGTNEGYKIVGAIMLKRKSEDLINELNEKKELLDTKINSLEKSETEFKKRADKIRKDILEQGGNDGGKDNRKE